MNRRNFVLGALALPVAVSAFQVSASAEWSSVLDEPGALDRLVKLVDFGYPGIGGTEERDSLGWALPSAKKHKDFVTLSWGDGFHTAQYDGFTTPEGCPVGHCWAKGTRPSVEEIAHGVRRLIDAWRESHFGTFGLALDGIQQNIVVGGKRFIVIVVNDASKPNDLLEGLRVDASAGWLGGWRRHEGKYAKWTRDTLDLEHPTFGPARAILRSVGSSLRGLRMGFQRPDLIVMDTKIDWGADRKWFHGMVLPVLDPVRGDLIWS